MLRRHVLATSAALALGATIGPVQAQAPGETLHIGAAISTSGATGVWGQQFEKGLRMLIEQLPNGKLAGYPVKLTVYDTETNSTRTAEACLNPVLRARNSPEVSVTGLIPNMPYSTS